MIVKGIIKSIDVQGNTCVVRMPYFETAGNDEIVATATVSNSPGSYNGYKVDDVVWVAFENDQLECPVIIGKLYLGIEAERADPRGTLNVVDSKVSRTAEIPFDTKLGRNLEPGMPKTLAPYNSLNSIANNLSTAEVNIAQNDREYGNRFSLAFENIEGNRSLINQTATDITNEVAATYVTQDGKSTSEAFGWSLKKDKWEVYKKINDKETPILVANEQGLEVKGKITAESGHIGKFIIGDEHTCTIKDTDGNTTDTVQASGIFSENFIETFEEEATKRGVYVGTDGIKVGSNFSVDTSGVVTATELVLKPENVYLDDDEEEIDPDTGKPIRRNLKNRLDKGDDNTSNLISALEHRLGEGITNTELTNEIITAPYLGVNGAYISGELLVGNDKDTPKLHINIDDPTVRIGGFEVSTSGISSNKDTAKYNTTFGDSAVGDSGVYVGTDGIRLGKNFEVDNEGNVVASSLKISATQSVSEAINEAASAAQSAAEQKASELADNAQTTAETNAANAVDTKFGIQAYTDKDGNGKILADKLAVRSAQIDDLVTDQLAVLTTDSEGKKQPILLVNASASDDGEITRTEGNVQIGGFNVSENTLSAEGKIQIKNPETGEEEEVDSKVSISTDAISVGPIDQTNNVPLVISGNGEIIASKGSFSGQITASGAELKDTSYFSMASDGEAVFNTLNANTISVSNNISTKGRINSNNGYFFGPDATCGLSLEGEIQYITQSCTISINASHMLVGGGTNDRYKITVSCSPAATKPITVTFSAAQWGTGINAVSIAGSTLTINAGSTSASTQRTITNTSKYQLMYTMDGDIGGGTLAGGSNNPTSITTSPRITKIEVDGSTLYSASGAGVTSRTITQSTPSSSSNLKLDCSSFQMNGNIIIPNTATFNVKGNSNANVVTLSKDGLTTDGKVQFKVNTKYYEPAIRLGTSGSPNCFWSKAFEIGGDGGSGWKSVSLPPDLQDSSGSSGNNSKIIAILATGKFPKDVDKKDPNSGDAQGATFYTWWNGTTAYVYNPISKAPSTFVINIVVLGKI